MSDSTEIPFSSASRQSPLNMVTAAAFYGAVPLTDLFDTIFKKLHPLFSIDCGVVLVYDKQLTVIKQAYVSTYLGDTEQIDADIITQPSELTAIQKIVAQFSFPVIKSMEEWVAEENANHSLINNQAHYKHHCYIPLEVDNQILGTLELHNSARELSTECLTFCSSIADILAEIIYLQQTQAAMQNSLAAVVPSRPVQEIKSSNEAEVSISLLIKLNHQLAQITDLDTLGDFVTKAAKLFPLAYEKIKSQIDEIEIYKKQLADDSQHVIEATKPGNYSEIIGSGPGMTQVFALLDQVAGTESTVLILGETGTGKELIARAIHEASPRKNKPLIKVNCAAIPANLIESELFGHERGAFTGATDKRIGKFELADNGTLFLDEIGELPLELQVKLLRALQEQEIERVGGKATIKVNVRIISATNRSLLAEVEQGLFRRDLYYRLHVFPISLPSLRERADDIPLLAMHFLAKYAARTGKSLTGFTQRAMRQMSNYNWPGNVREMEHLIERQVLLNKKPLINELDIPKKDKAIIDGTGIAQKVKTIDENECDHIFAILKLCKGRISGDDGAAKLLGVPATTLNSKMKRLGINKKHF